LYSRLHLRRRHKSCRRCYTNTVARLQIRRPDYSSRFTFLAIRPTGQREQSPGTKQKVFSVHNLNLRKERKADKERKERKADKERKGRKGREADKRRKACKADKRRKERKADKERKGRKADKERKGREADKERKGRKADKERKGRKANKRRKERKADKERKGRKTNKEREESISTLAHFHISTLFAPSSNRQIFKFSNLYPTLLLHRAVMYIE
jgi:hypothetical protein